MSEKKTIPLAVPEVGEEEISKIREVVATGFLTEGQTTKEFEQNVANYLGVKHAIAVTSCTTGFTGSGRVRRPRSCTARPLSAFAPNASRRFGPC